LEEPHKTYFLRMLINSLSLDESSEPLIWVSAEPGAGVDRFGVDGREEGFEPCGVVVAEGYSDDGAAAAMLAVCVVAVGGLCAV